MAHNSDDEEQKTNQSSVIDDMEFRKWRFSNRSSKEVSGINAGKFLKPLKNVRGVSHVEFKQIFMKEMLLKKN